MLPSLVKASAADYLGHFATHTEAVVARETQPESWLVEILTHEPAYLLQFADVLLSEGEGLLHNATLAGTILEDAPRIAFYLTYEAACRSHACDALGLAYSKPDWLVEVERELVTAG